jgi:hypothetical protein
MPQPDSTDEQPSPTKNKKSIEGWKIFLCIVAVGAFIYLVFIKPSSEADAGTGSGTGSGSGGATKCWVKAPGGSYCKETTGSPIKCAAGTYVTVREGDTFASPRECTPCTKGNYCPPESSEDTPCSPGFICPKFTEMKPCPAGKYCAGAGADAKDCAFPAYCPQGSSKQQICPDGTDCPDPATSNLCPAGAFCTGGVKTPCPAGSYCPAKSAAPKPCAADTYCPAGAASATPCPSGTKSAAGSGSASDCKSPIPTPIDGALLENWPNYPENHGGPANDRGPQGQWPFGSTLYPNDTVGLANALAVPGIKAVVMLPGARIDLWLTSNPDGYRNIIRNVAPWKIYPVNPPIPMR